MRPNAVLRALGHYLTTTTLHGFKYLYAPYRADRVAWLVSCCASACCAGVLCTVLWTRFAQVPNLLSLPTQHVSNSLPHSGICVTREILGRLVVTQLFGANYSLLAQPLSRVVRGKNVSEQQLVSIEKLLSDHHTTLPQAMLKYAPKCKHIIKRCRANGVRIDCDAFITQELTPYGACCVAKPNRLIEDKNNFGRVVHNLEIVINCSKEYRGYNYITRYEGKGWIKSGFLVPGYLYIASLKFQSIIGGDLERLGSVTCEDDVNYSRIECLTKCAENICGCSDPFDDVEEREDVMPCSLSKMHCIKNHVESERWCSCPSECRKVTTFMSLEYTYMNALHHDIDPLYEGVNASDTAALHMSVKNIGSRVFMRMPTENWLTLLSSLGGVFNMFLGVGLFSALELLYFVLVRVPIAIRASLEMDLASLT